MVHYFFALLFILEIYFCFKDLNKALILSVIISLFIPFIIKYSVGPINLNVYNLAIIAFALGSARNIKKKNLISTKLRKIYLGYFGFLFISSIIASSYDFSIASIIKNHVLFLIEYFIVGYCLLYTKKDQKNIIFFNYTLCIVVLLIGIYGIYNYITKTNPYVLYVCTITNNIDATSYFLEEERGTISSRVSSTFTHPLIYGEFILLITSYLYYQLKHSVKKIFYWIFMCFLFICGIISGSRSTILPLFLIPVIDLLYHKKEKLILYILGFIVIIPIIISFVPSKYQSTFKSLFFFWQNNNNISGSSLDLRLEQLNFCFRIIEDSPILGKGFGYIRDFGSKFTEMFGYESFLFQTLVENGILGSIIFFGLFWTLTKYLYKQCKNRYQKAQSLSLCICYSICIFLTGISYSTFSFFIILYFMTLYSLRNQNISLKTERISCR